MKKNFFLILFFSLLFSNVVNANDDWESWNGITFKREVSEKWQISLFVQDRLKYDMDNLYYWFVSPSITYKVNQHWSMGAGYFYARDENMIGKWDDEHRYILKTMWKDTWADFNVDMRFQYEYRDWHTDPRPRYRHRFKIAYPIRILNTNISPYISEEPFYDIEDHRFNQNRAIVGFKFPIVDKVTLDMFYMYIATKGADDWQGRSVLGSQIEVKF